MKCGGHSHSGKSTCDGGMMIDLCLMRGVRVDPSGAHRATSSGGSLLGDMDNETMAHSASSRPRARCRTRASAGSRSAAASAASARRFGLSLDNVRAVDIVTADGELVHASADENPELYWGVRGGGGNFGVVTSFEFELHPMQREVIGGNLVFPFSEARQLLDFYAEYEASAPDELFLSMASAEQPARASRLVQRLLQRPEQRSRARVREGPRRRRHAAARHAAHDRLRRAAALGRRRRSARRRLVYEVRLLGGPQAGLHRRDPGRLRRAAGRQLRVLPHHCGGAINRVAADATAFPHREITLTSLLAVTGRSTSDPTTQIAWLRQYWASVEPHMHGFYTNDVIDETQKQIDENYLGNYPRLWR